MEGLEDAQVKTQRTRGTKDRASRIPSDSDGEAGLTGSSQQHGNINRRDGGATGKGADLFIAITGGILSQLIEQMQDQLGSVEYQVNNAQECIEWYEREKEAYEKRAASLRQKLNNLRDLQEQLQEQLEIEA
jgi:chromosome segregation ATPase